jgi:dolichyl-phosphate beta-glucosyltransferase
MDLSLVIPAYNESKKIARDIQAAARFFGQERLRGEIIVVDDGSEDGTATVAENAGTPAATTLRVIRNDRHRGKGFAVRTGILQTRGEFVMFADSGLPVPYDNALRGLRLLQNGSCELAHASRRLPESVIRRPQPWQRRLLSLCFHGLVIFLLKIPKRLSDTQCGFKIYRGEIARELFAECFTEGFMFDLEIILRALQRGYRIEEFPVEWTCDPDSRLSVTRSPRRILSELMALKKRIVDPRRISEAKLE